MNLVKVGEVEKYLCEGTGYPLNIVNDRLREGWILVSVQTLANRGYGSDVNPELTVFILGKPRERKDALRSVPIDTSTNDLQKVDLNLDKLRGKAIPKTVQGSKPNNPNVFPDKHGQTEML